MLRFISTGDAFSKEHGNNSAYYKLDEETLILFDCGESVFKDIINSNILNDVRRIYTLITHLHSDHVGSLGSLIFYCDYLNKIDVNVVYQDTEDIRQLLNLFGIDENDYKLLKPQDIKEFSLECYKQQHSNINAYGYLFDDNKNAIFYSGDTQSIPAEIMDKLKDGEIDYFYQDVRENENSYHIGFDTLTELVPEECRDKIWCMHLADNFDRQKIIEQGFNVASDDEFQQR